MEKPNNGNGVQSLNRTFDILEFFLENKDSVRIKDISHKLGLHKSTVHRILSAMAHRGYIRQDRETGKYQLGLRIMELYNALVDNNELIKIAHPVLERLSGQSHEAVHLLVMDNDEAVYVDKVEFPNTIHLRSHIGKRVSLHCTASGKIFLANLPEDKVRSIIKKKGLPRYTKNTIISETLLMEELDKINRQGCSLDNVENEEGVRCVAVPVRDSTGKVIAALSISGPTMRVKSRKIPVFVRLAQEGGDEISRFLGYRQKRLRKEVTL